MYTYIYIYVYSGSAAWNFIQEFGIRAIKLGQSLELGKSLKKTLPTKSTDYQCCSFTSVHRGCLFLNIYIYNMYRGSLPQLFFSLDFEIVRDRNTVFNLTYNNTSIVLAVPKTIVSMCFSKKNMLFKKSVYIYIYNSWILLFSWFPDFRQVRFAFKKSFFVT